jgi:hypothetical protein
VKAFVEPVAKRDGEVEQQPDDRSEHGRLEQAGVTQLIWPHLTINLGIGTSCVGSDVNVA